jgi:hypothetical protein
MGNLPEGALGGRSAAHGSQEGAKVQGRVGHGSKTLNTV